MMAFAASSLARARTKCPLAKTVAFETIRLRREEAMQALEEAMFQGLEAEAAEEVPVADPMSALGIDEPTAGLYRPKSVPRRRKRMREVASFAAHPPSLTVGLGPGLEIEVLAEVGKCLPAIAAAASCFWVVFRLVQQELDGA